VSEKQTVYTVYRQLNGANGTNVYVPLKTFSKESDAHDACKAMRDMFNTLSEGLIVVDKKPVTTVKNFFANLGVSTVGFHYIATEVNDSLVIAPRPMIVALQ
jgi:hypothetical protein